MITQVAMNALNALPTATLSVLARDINDSDEVVRRLAVAAKQLVANRTQAAAVAA